MRSKLATFEVGREMSLESCMPEVQRQFNQLHGEVKNSNEMNGEGFRRLHERFDTMETSRGEMATGLVELGHRIGGSSVARVDGTTTTTTITARGGGAMAIDEDDAEFQKANGHKIRIRDIDSVDDIYNEYKGKGNPCQDRPIVGGLEACDRKWKTKWRKHFNAADQKRFSRMTMLAKAIDDQVAKGEQLRDVLGKFDFYFRRNRSKRRSFCALIVKLQEEGFIEKKAGRAKRVRSESPGEGGGGG
jgi:hypothetical protein